ncbi:MAG: hypothetical protein [Caudoviricetes sp.]|nr:MAG: hypothetical protein [Caudoviricetes sp.]
MIKNIAISKVNGSPDARIGQSNRDGHYWVQYGELGFLKTPDYDEASQYYKVCVLKQLGTI